MDDEETRREFGDSVNMTAKQLEDWLKTDEAKDAGQHKGGGESVGHESGRRIVGILRKKNDDLTADDHAHMRKVVGYVHRHLGSAPVRRRHGDDLAVLAHELGTRPPALSE